MSIYRAIILVISLLIILGIIYLIGIYNPISMEFIINQHGQIKNIISEQPILSLIGTIFIVVFMISIMGPIPQYVLLQDFILVFIRVS